MNTPRVVLAVFVLLPALACSPEVPDSPSTTWPEGYEAAWQQWRSDRVAGLTARDGWLNLVGLHWLDFGESTPQEGATWSFGYGPDNQVVFEDRPSADGAPPVLGTLEIRLPDHFLLTSAEEAGLAIDGQPAAPGKPISLTRIEPAEDQAPLAEVTRGPIAITLISRGGNWALRVRDRSIDSAALLEGGIETWEPQPRFLIAARFEPFDEVRLAEVPNVTPFAYGAEALGEVLLPLADDHGVVTEHRILALGTDRSEPLFLIIADQTNGRNSYGGGRYLYAGPPDKDNRLTVDLNRLYNPPCAFTGWATCPLPPRQNRLEVAIEAGEKSWDHHLE